MEKREEAECEVYRDLKKSTKHLLINVYEELLKKYPTFEENIIHANKSSEENIKLQDKVKFLTYIIIGLVVVQIIIGFF